MALKKKLLKGLKNIHFAPFVEGEYTTPIRIHNAVSIEVSLNYESEPEWGDSVLIDDEFSFAGGEGKLAVKGLSKEEFAALFSTKIVKGGVVVNANDISPEGAFLFERGRKSSREKRLYVVYIIKCSPSSIQAEGIEEGKGAAGVDEIEFVVGSLENGDIYHFIDTDDPTVDSAAKEGWFTTVQKPVEIVPAREEKEVKETLSLQKQFEKSCEK
ncbi:MAG: hypothetical protein ACRCX8_08430 [Sarcina sp.]